MIVLRTAAIMTALLALIVLSWMVLMGAVLVVQDVTRLIAEQIA